MSTTRNENDAIGARSLEDATHEELLEAFEAAQTQIEQLETALRSRVVLEQAKGVLRERFGWSTDHAFHILRHAARSSRTPLRDVAAQVVASHETPMAITFALARDARLRSAHAHERSEAQHQRAAELIAAATDLQDTVRRGRRARRPR